MPDSHSSLQDWLCFLETRHSQEIQLGLSRVQAVASSLFLDKTEALVITVAGTNGKGSTVAALEAIYHAAGYKVGTYTSPHLLSFNERIQINGIPISDGALCSAFQTIEEGRQDILLTYFETVTLAAFWYFKQFSLDLLILEVGMGGRQDAVNLLDPDLSIITTVDFDHQEYLGHTLNAIAYEKAGILRAHKPCIYADIDPPETLIEQAHSLDVSLWYLNQNYFFEVREDVLYIQKENEALHPLPLPNIHVQAAVAARIASHCLQERLPVAEAAYKKAMQTVSIAARQQIIPGEVTTLIDVAHNPQAAKSLAKRITQLPKKGTLYAVFSALQDKDLYGLIEALLPYVDIWYLALLEGKRAADQQQLLSVFKKASNRECICFKSPLMAYEHAKKEAQPGDTILVYGSFLTVSPILKNATAGERV